MQQVVGQRPEHFGLPRSRWGLSYKRGRRYVHSPDPLYQAKLATIGYVCQRAQVEPQRVVVLYEDDLIHHCRPSVGDAYVPTGSDVPRAVQGLGSDTLRRIAGCLDSQSGQFYSQQRAHWTVDALTRFLQEVAAHYPVAERLYIVLDN